MHHTNCKVNDIVGGYVVYTYKFKFSFVSSLAIILTVSQLLLEQRVLATLLVKVHTISKEQSSSESGCDS